MTKKYSNIIFTVIKVEIELFLDVERKWKLQRKKEMKQYEN